MLENVATTVTDEPVEITIDVLPQGKIHSTLQRFNICSKKRVYKVKQITLGNLNRISKLILSIGELNFTNQSSIMTDAIAAMSKHSKTLAEIVAIAIHNKRKYPSQEMIDFVEHNFTPSELHGVLGIVLRQMNIQDFIISIVSIKGMTILKASPNDQGS